MKIKYLLFILLALMLTYSPVATAPKVAHALSGGITYTNTPIDLNSGQAQKSYFIRLRDYPIGTWYPNRSDNCGGSASEYKVLPFLGDTSYPYARGLTSFNWSGNQINAEGACNGKSYYTGGTARNDGAWIPTDQVAGWALPGVASGWSTPSLVKNSSGTCMAATLCSGWITKVPQIWGMPHAYGSDPTEAAFQNNYGALKSRTGNTSDPGVDKDTDGTTPIEGLSSGTTLFRNEFNLTQSQIDKINAIYLDIQADDFLAIYINGQPVARYSSIQNLTNVDLTSYKQFLRTDTTNVLAFQVSDKIDWARLPLGYTASGRAGLYYDMTIYQDAVPSCPAPTISPTTGVSPLTVKFIMRANNLANPFFRMEFGDGTPAQIFNNGTSTFTTYHTYKYISGSETSGYQINLKENTSGLTCSTAVIKVKPPTSSSGSEVAP